MRSASNSKRKRSQDDAKNEHQSVPSSDESSKDEKCDENSSEDDSDSEELSLAPKKEAVGEARKDKADSGNEDLVNVEFVFSDPKQCHYQSIKQLMSSCLSASLSLDTAELADIIVDQVEIGTVVCVSDEPDAYGFITVLNLRHYEERKCIQQLLSYVRKHCPLDQKDEFEEMLKTKDVGLFLNERLFNLPYQLIPALHSALHQDIEWAISNSEQSRHKKFHFDYFLVLTTCSIEQVNVERKARTKADNHAVQTKLYQKFEDEFLESQAQLMYSFETPREERDHLFGAPQAKTRITDVYLIQRQNHKDALENISAMIDA
uniref:BCCIP family protein putative n=1 Tax=Albugo laibachii Nc14 TaxID=890382 RepID=F0VZ06_9STRA|nr:BCCIP family protein putative [Albugo laibachii Nc14]|eukprot:CCA14021.1 BCCIP family protein putative [Albugo laibachii Nc14]